MWVISPVFLERKYFLILILLFPSYLFNLLNFISPYSIFQRYQIPQPTMPQYPTRRDSLDVDCDTNTSISKGGPREWRTNPILYTITDQSSTWAYDNTSASQNPKYMDDVLQSDLLGTPRRPDVLIVEDEPSSPESSASSISWDNVQSDCSSPDENEVSILDVSPVPDFAFAFDIDGVLLKGGLVIPEAILALKALNEAKVPYIFVTNVSSHNHRFRDNI